MAESINFKNEVYWDSSSISHNKKKLSDILFPVNSIYLSVSNTNPTNYFGGTWTQIAQGRTLVGVDTSDSDFNAVKKTGGEKTHTLTIDEIPKHSHRGVYLKAENVTTAYNVGYRVSHSSETPASFNDSRGNDQPHNNMPPYFTCYIWLRTA